MQTAETGGELLAPARFRGTPVPLVVRVVVLLLAVGSLLTDIFSSQSSYGWDVLRVVQLAGLTLGLSLTLWFPLPGAALSLVGAAAGVAVDPTPTVFFLGLQLVVLVLLEVPTITRWFCWSVLLLMLVGVATAPFGARIGPAVTGVVVGAVLVQQRYADQLRRRLAREARAREQAERSVREAVAQERRKLADDLHDMIAHDLTILGLQADMALIQKDTATTESALIQVSTSSRDALANLRLMMQTLSLASAAAQTSSPLEVADITAARLRTLGHRVDLRMGEGVERIAPEQAAVVSQILRECGTNIAKHSDGHAPVRIECGVTGADLLLTVANTLPADHADAPAAGGGGQGSQSIAARAASVGGCVSLGPVGEEWVVTARIPLAAAPRSA